MSSSMLDETSESASTSSLVDYIGSFRSSKSRSSSIRLSDRQIREWEAIDCFDIPEDDQLRLSKNKSEESFSGHMSMGDKKKKRKFLEDAIKLKKTMSRRSSGDVEGLHRSSDEVFKKSKSAKKVKKNRSKSGEKKMSGTFKLKTKPQKKIEYTYLKEELTDEVVKSDLFNFFIHFQMGRSGHFLSVCYAHCLRDIVLNEESFSEENSTRIYNYYLTKKKHVFAFPYSKKKRIKGNLSQRDAFRELKSFLYEQLCFEFKVYLSVNPSPKSDPIGYVQDSKKAKLIDFSSVGVTEGLLRLIRSNNLITTLECYQDIKERMKSKKQDVKNVLKHYLNAEKGLDLDPELISLLKAGHIEQKTLDVVIEIMNMKLINIYKVYTYRKKICKLLAKDPSIINLDYIMESHKIRKDFIHYLMLDNMESMALFYENVRTLKELNSNSPEGYIDVSKCFLGISDGKRYLDDRISNDRVDRALDSAYLGLSCFDPIIQEIREYLEIKVLSYGDLLADELTARKRTHRSNDIMVYFTENLIPSYIEKQFHTKNCTKLLSQKYLLSSYNEYHSLMLTDTEKGESMLIGKTGTKIISQLFHNGDIYMMYAGTIDTYNIDHGSTQMFFIDLLEEERNPIMLCDFSLFCVITSEHPFTNIYHWKSSAFKFGGAEPRKFVLKRKGASPLNDKSRLLSSNTVILVSSSQIEIFSLSDQKSLLCRQYEQSDKIRDIYVPENQNDVFIVHSMYSLSVYSNETMEIINEYNFESMKVPISSFFYHSAGAAYIGGSNGIIYRAHADIFTEMFSVSKTNSGSIEDTRIADLSETLKNKINSIAIVSRYMITTMRNEITVWNIKEDPPKILEKIPTEGSINITK
eukprot:TRINITY_DN1718_c0_g1_i2.p1 TRINITY_DN1718_c0_g1~~TRINITY_DN1718_c0_g1_i2.p1  ORF type:complete len:886 (+),score=178.97 TRINITY_DN1718_c0_g1_i2:78-2660(+)